eukprot:263918-Amphidinium_carterae.4
MLHIVGLRWRKASFASSSTCCKFYGACSSRSRPNGLSKDWKVVIAIVILLDQSVMSDESIPGK